MLLRSAIIVLTIYVLAFSEAAPEPLSVKVIPLVKYEGKNYFIGNTFKATALQALRFCQNINMSLLSIDSEAENKAVRKFIKDSKIDSSYWWIAGSRIIDGRSWIWLTTGKEIEYINWDVNQPSNTYDYCLSVKFDSRDQVFYDDTGCDYEYPFVCQSTDIEGGHVSKDAVWSNIFESSSWIVSDSFVFENKNFYFAKQFKGTFWQSLQFCDSIGMKPASILSEAENKRLYKHLRDTNGEAYWWTSGTRTTDRTNWFWLSNGHHINYTNWNAGEPYYRGTEQCLDVILYKATGLVYNDAACSTVLPVICERPIGLTGRHKRDVEAVKSADECEQPVINIYINNNIPAEENQKFQSIRVDDNTSGNEHTVLVDNKLNSCQK